jgi:hypothetical protein
MQLCPSCKLIDKAQKVSAIVSGGATNLAQRLSLPSAPSVVRPGGCSTVLLIVSVVLAIILLGIASSTSRGVPFYQSNWNIAIGVLIFAAIVVIHRIWVTRSAVQQEQALAKWNQMRSRWDKLYYCHRCDIVYVDGESTHAPPENMLSVLSR